MKCMNACIFCTPLQTKIRTPITTTPRHNYCGSCLNTFHWRTEIEGKEPTCESSNLSRSFTTCLSFSCLKPTQCSREEEGGNQKKNIDVLEQRKHEVIQVINSTSISTKLPVINYFDALFCHVNRPTSSRCSDTHIAFHIKLSLNNRPRTI
jgi:hypothetical protein